MEACPNHDRGNRTTTKASSRQECTIKIKRDRLRASQVPKPKLDATYEPERSEVET